jgi:2-phosphosulfolactate phosphatase
MDEWIFSQHPYRCRLEWGRLGTHHAAMRGDILVIVDTLSFSTATTIAVHFGRLIYPCAKNEDPNAFAGRILGEVAVKRGEVPEKGRYSLSPLTFIGHEEGKRVILPSINGATCIRYSPQVPHLFIGALVNAKAVARAVSNILESTQLCVSLIACGERERTSSIDGELRVAVEDYLGAGAVLSYLKHSKSPEARVCEGAFISAEKDLRETIWDCISGRELRNEGFGDDVEVSAQLNAYETVPKMYGEYFDKTGLY